MKTVTVDREELTATIKKNRHEHVEVVVEAQAEYKRLCIEQMEENLADAKEGEDPVLFIQLSKPVDYTKKYDTAIHMLEMMIKTQSVVELTNAEFCQYVEDEWDWSDNWKMSNSLYSSKIRM